jgi:hypothetical protein
VPDATVLHDTTLYIHLEEHKKSAKKYILPIPYVIEKKLVMTAVSNCGFMNKKINRRWLSSGLLRHVGR